jgi:hypothetical protein
VSNHKANRRNGTKAARFHSGSDMMAEGRIV